MLLYFKPPQASIQAITHFSNNKWVTVWKHTPKQNDSSHQIIFQTKNVFPNPAHNLLKPNTNAQELTNCKCDKRTLHFKGKVRLIIQTFITLTSILLSLKNSKLTSFYTNQKGRSSTGGKDWSQASIGFAWQSFGGKGVWETGLLAGSVTQWGTHGGAVCSWRIAPCGSIQSTLDLYTQYGSSQDLMPLLLSGISQGRGHTKGPGLFWLVQYCKGTLSVMPIFNVVTWKELLRMTSLPLGSTTKFVIPLYWTNVKHHQPTSFMIY